MKSVIISIKPYWVFLIIAKTMGWNIAKEKTVEVRKTCPKDDEWNKVGKIYCTKDKQSFNCIPKEYQPFMQKFLGKVIGEFVCDNIFPVSYTMDGFADAVDCNTSCLSPKDFIAYGKGKALYGWHISDLVIYDEPKELSDFYTKCNELCENCDLWESVRMNEEYDMECASKRYGYVPIKRPAQSWCYVEGVKE